MTLLCVPLMVDEVDAALADARTARDLGADLVEYRVDDLFHGEGDDAGQEAVLRWRISCNDVVSARIAMISLATVISNPV